MTLPTIQVLFDFGNGPVFGYPFIIGSDVNGIIGVSAFGDASADIVDISNQVGKININRGYNLIQDDFQAGTATVRVFDPTGAWNPENPSSEYFPKLLPLRKMRILANDINLFSGYTTAYNYTYDKEQNLGYVDIQLSDAFRLFNMANVTTITGSSAGQTTGQRIDDILDSVSWPTSMREIDTGSTTVAADPGNAKTSLQAIKNIEFCEQGAFYIGTSGNAEFHSRNFIVSQSGQNPTYFSNSGDGIEYNNVKFALDDKLVINQCTIKRTGGTDQYAFNSTSIDKYFPHSFTASELLLQTDAQALDVARTFVATRQETVIRIDAMTLDLNTPDYTAGITAALNLDFFDTISIKNVGQDGSTIEKVLQCMGVRHEITPSTHMATFVTSEPIVDGFLIGSTLYGIIGTSVMTY
jgi:hypothetical protein